MAFIDTTAPLDTAGAARALYQQQQARCGYVPNYAKVFCHRPEIMTLWAELLAGLRRPVDHRCFELITFAAAHALHNSYCALAHGEALLRFLAVEEVRALARGEVPSSVTDEEAAMMVYARQVARDAASITAEDIDALRAHGFSDADIFDIAAIAAGRAFFAKIADALGVEADSRFQNLIEPLRHALVVGRPISEAAAEAVP